MSLNSRRTGFSLVELLAVSGAVVLLAMVLVGCIVENNEGARRANCKNNLKQIGLALHNYHQTFTKFPQGWVGVDPESRKADVSGLNGWGWCSRITPYLDQVPLYNSIDYKMSVTDAVNSSVLKKSFPTLHCPSDPFRQDSWQLKDASGAIIAEVGTSNYVGSFGKGSLSKCEGMKPGEECVGDGLFFHNSRISIADVTDGTANTLAVGERSMDEKGDRLSTWTGVFPNAKAPFSRILGSGDNSLNPKASQVSGYASPHRGGVNFVLLDGAVRFIKDDLDLKILQALSTRAGMDQIGE